MTKKLVIEIKRENEYAKELLKNYQFRMFNITQKGLFQMLVRAPRKKATHYKADDFHALIEEEGDDRYIDIQRKKFEAFIFSDSSELNSGKAYQEYAAYKNDRWMQKVFRKIGKAKNKVKDGVLRKIMGDSTVMGWFAKMGILITYRVEDLDIETENYK